MTSSTSTPRTGTTVRGRARMILAVNMGNALEWFDWTVFAIFAVYFSNQFFHSDNEVSNLLSTMAVFAVGFVMRPLGGLFFGLVADRRGRKFVMVLTMSLVAASSVLIAVAPTYGQSAPSRRCGYWWCAASRGLAHGGEQGGSYTYIAEVARPDNRALWGSTVIMSTVGGTVLATLLGAVIAPASTRPTMSDWGWRIPFLIGGLLGSSRSTCAAASPSPRRSRTRPKPPPCPSPGQDGPARRVGAARIDPAGRHPRRRHLGVLVHLVGERAGVRDQLPRRRRPPRDVVRCGGEPRVIAALPLAAMLADRVGRRVNNMVWGYRRRAAGLPTLRAARRLRDQPRDGDVAGTGPAVVRGEHAGRVVRRTVRHQVARHGHRHRGLARGSGVRRHRALPEHVADLAGFGGPLHVVRRGAGPVRGGRRLLHPGDQGDGAHTPPTFRTPRRRSRRSPDPGAHSPPRTALL
ncbi:MFS transporter [Rhodococcus hoagii]|nr:MFS transporter [Prescottella equi]NKZ87503.1 MFS transporter [Prescottella equi]